MKLFYPARFGREYRWAESNSVRGMLPTHPCCPKECEGHPNAFEATLHHATWFCINARINELFDEVCAKRCQGCSKWTNRSVIFVNCPFADYIPVCHACTNSERTLLTTNHMLRRELTGIYRSWLKRIEEVEVANARSAYAY